jgi:hypothetical protein
VAPTPEVGQVGANATGSATFEDTGLTDSTRYYQVVVGINANGESPSRASESSAYDEEPAGKTDECRGDAADSASQITLTWDDPGRNRRDGL